MFYLAQKNIKSASAAIAILNCVRVSLNLEGRVRVRALLPVSIFGYRQLTDNGLNAPWALQKIKRVSPIFA